jgi:hypothetical protein
LDYIKGVVKRTATRVGAMDPANSLASVLEKLIAKFSDGELKTILY